MEDYDYQSVGPGWHDLLVRLVTDLLALGWNGEVSQVKEKFGGLRFYINAGTSELWDRIDVAESESLRTCEECGKPGSMRNKRGWLSTRCDEHAPPTTTTQPELDQDGD